MLVEAKMLREVDMKVRSGAEKSPPQNHVVADVKSSW